MKPPRSAPLATEQILKDVDEQVKTSVAAGALILTGGRKLDRAGNYYEPTVLVNIPADSPASCEEIFGPVAMLFRVNNIGKPLISLRRSSFGLSAAALDNEQNEQERFSDELRSKAAFH